VKPRLDRYEEFIEREYKAGLRKYDEYSTEFVRPELISMFRNREVKRIVFTGMGCSAIVSDIVRGYFTEIGLPVEVFVLNDYEFTFLAPKSVLEDPGTVFIISSYSGHSKEPLRAYRSISDYHDRTMLLTSGGPLAEAGRRDGTSIAYWRLREPDREYPLFHVSQYFAILMDMFHEFGMLDDDHHERLARLSEELAADFDDRARELVSEFARNSRDANILMIASPKWYESLLKLAKMHINEMAMVPASRNYFHEFCHSEVATLSDPERRHSVLWIVDPEDDAYTKAKGQNLVGLLTARDPQNDRIRVTVLPLRGGDFLRRYFGALDIIQRATLELGRYREVESRDLISSAAGNAWYHSSTIDAEFEQALAS
jgi:glucose/mannose-6-phosphate isomerase